MGALFIVLPRTLVSQDVQSSAGLVLIENPSQPQTADSSIQGQVEFQDATRWPLKTRKAVRTCQPKAEAGQTVVPLSVQLVLQSYVCEPLPRFYDVLRWRNPSDANNVQIMVSEDLRNK